MESARLRKAFRYPDDSGDDIAREELDEEGPLKPCPPKDCSSDVLFLEQERVIKNLKIQNEERDSQYSVTIRLPCFARSCYVHGY
jgi:hypothetical protein